MDSLSEFRKWAEKLGHYHAVSAVDRYLAMLESLKEADKEQTK